ncbi:MAG: ABC transporter ATP-binding protein [Alphaproteobacteria bacterium]|jgi:branched-chain amino acid transport system ATP-binding protein|nr:ABC transporter ATP-binding protein [Alphaproteobacteria bacterium]
MSALLRLDRVGKSFGALRVTDDLSLSLAPGEALGILGPNGAGKSTMFNLITGHLRPDSGRVFYDGRDITALDPSARCRQGIGRSFQIPHPFVGMTVYENLLVGAVFGGGMAEAVASAHCRDVLQRTGLIAKADRLAGSLTLLDRKRLELARAMASRPRLLLLDEIAGGLTDDEAMALTDTINDLRRDGVSIVWIEHVVRALLRVVDRLVVINFGRLLQEGLPDAVMASREVREVYMGIEA